MNNPTLLITLLFVLISCTAPDIEGKVTVRISKEHSSWYNLDDVKRDIVFSSAFSDISIDGLPREVIAISLDPTAIYRYGISYESVTEAIQNHFNVEIPWIVQTKKSQLVIPYEALKGNSNIDGLETIASIIVDSDEAIGISLAHLAKIEFRQDNQEVLYNGEDIYRITCDYRGNSPEGDFHVLDSLLKIQNIHYKGECVNEKGKVLFLFSRN